MSFDDEESCHGHDEHSECGHEIHNLNKEVTDLREKLSAMYTKHPESDGCYAALPKLRTRIAELEAQLEEASKFPDGGPARPLPHLTPLNSPSNLVRRWAEYADWLERSYVAQNLARGETERQLTEEREKCMADVCPRCRNKEPVHWWDTPVMPYWAHYNSDNGYTVGACRADAIRQRGAGEVDG